MAGMHAAICFIRINIALPASPKISALRVAAVINLGPYWTLSDNMLPENLGLSVSVSYRIFSQVR